MKQESFYVKRIYPLVFMLLITIVCIALTSGLYLATRERVIANESLFLKKTVLEAAGVDYPDDFMQVTELFNQIVEEKTPYYIVQEEGQDPVFVVPAAGAGLWGPIELMVGFADTLEALTGISIVSQNETPGLGARIEEPWFKQQFIGKWGPFTLVEEGTADAGNEIDAITGATRTSRSIQNIMNRAIAEGPAVITGEE